MPDSRYVWMDGKMLPFENATVHFMTAGLHYGVAVFEGIRCYATANGPAIFRLHEHMQRLLESARVLGFSEMPFTLEQLTDAVRHVVAANGFQECYVRPLIYLADGGWDLNVDSGKPHAAVGVWKWDAYLGKEAREHGVRANVSSFTRHHANVMMTKAKVSGNYANSVLAKTESRRLGFDEAILLDPQDTLPSALVRTSSWCAAVRSAPHLRPRCWKASRATASWCWRARWA